MPSYLTTRAEQALIGAMLTARPMPDELAPLHTEHFGHRVLGELHLTITELRQHVPLGQLIDAVAARVEAPGVDRDWLTRLRDSAPPADHLSAYVRMVQADAFRRDIAVDIDRIAADAATAEPGPHADRLARLVTALTRQAEVYLTPAEPALDVAVRADNGDVTPAVTRQGREEQVLADLLAHPEQAAEIARIVDPATFTSLQRREIFETIVSLAEAGDVIDEVIVGWTIDNQRAVQRLYGQPGHDVTTDPEPHHATLARLANTVVAGTAISIGYELVVADETVRLAVSARAAQARQHPEHTHAKPAPPQLDPTLQQPVQPNLNQAKPAVDR